ncbi:hypothetical protein [Neptuniibacter sp. CAU 1671]|uniref:hypothetical protein n=1 Tax=Neptuniibacter sp. CAU 1671 TaxID=3032593 RepID=UPI0023DC395E|nr:hypothetical protein [Neptuniibacter sp. CAU 1671]
MDDENSVEHVFPKWLQNRYELWDQKVGLLNLSFLAYRQLTIPCCKACNNQHLSQLEGEVIAAVRGGFEKAVQLPSKTWYLWAGKIFYGLLRKELSLLLERSNPNRGTIATPEILESFSNLHLFMQGLRGRHKFIGDVPYSVLVCNLHEFGSLYDFRDNLFAFTLAIRMGEIGLIVSFEDGGLIRNSYEKYVDEVGGRKLHPIQFYELYAKVSYQVTLPQSPVYYWTQSHVDGHYIATTELAKSSMFLADWDQEEYVKLLRFHVSHCLAENSEVVFEPPDRVSSWMIDEKGELLLLSKEAWESLTQ